MVTDVGGVVVVSCFGTVVACMVGVKVVLMLGCTGYDCMNIIGLRQT